MFPNLQASLEVIFDKYDVILLSTALSIAFAYIYLTITQYEKQVASGKAKIEQVIKDAYFDN